MTKQDPLAILGLPMPEGNDAGATTVGNYFLALLTALWKRGAGFSGKRPFGASGWKGDIEEALVRAGYVEGSFDEDGYLDTVDALAVDELITSAIAELGRHCTKQQ